MPVLRVGMTTIMRYVCVALLLSTASMTVAGSPAVEPVLDSLCVVVSLDSDGDARVVEKRVMRVEGHGAEGYTIVPPLDEDSHLDDFKVFPPVPSAATVLQPFPSRPVCCNRVAALPPRPVCCDAIATPLSPQNSSIKRPSRGCMPGNHHAEEKTFLNIYSISNIFLTFAAVLNKQVSDDLNIR